MALLRVVVMTTLVLAIFGGAEATHTKLRSRAKGILGGYTAIFGSPECTCDCCIVEKRRPAEVDLPITSKCAVPPPNDPRNEIYSCPKACTTINDGILSNTNVVAMERYCFYECQPASNDTPDIKVANAGSIQAAFNGGSLYDTACVPLSPLNIPDAVDSNGNARDSEVPAVR